MYIWERPDWPDLTWDSSHLAALLGQASREQGRLLGRMQDLGFDLRREAQLNTLTEDVVRSSEIEGEKLDSAQVRSSIARRLGMDVGGLVPADRDVEGVVEMMLDATTNYAQPVARLPEDMDRFLSWFEAPGKIDPLLIAGLAHVWFVTIHPFDDGNGRIARAIADMALAHSEQSTQRFYSMSAQIRRERSNYYSTLERTQKGTLDVTPWQEWFLSCMLRAIEGSQDTLGAVLEKARFWERFAQQSLDARQVKGLNRFLSGFEGKLTTSKYAKLTKGSQDTAYRDILDLVERGALRKDPGGGRSTSYSLIMGVERK